ncbi:hypothetical protein EDC39_104122 [Geothermobacter ehrlichii]|uniref:Uncharacterized protein n=1 Tax=Geothermobacter ehrlichii TaxID=213224 RepID=A0A5D3WKT3_9BACT|nr:hypothetical protein [Geothermobacter ehrlichii]TYO98998.1 hypothetical protein EDC39_104122 [Geothermobacter ehrlichii]
MKTCAVCGERFHETAEATDPAAEMGAFLAREVYADAGRLCLKCLANRGRLALMYMREFD